MGSATGIIAIWSGALVDIPDGWVLCNGSNGTPDLRSNFIQGAAVGANPGTVSGANTHSHNDHPIQTHVDIMSVAAHAARSHTGGSATAHTTKTINPINNKTLYNPAHTIASQSTAHPELAHVIASQADDHSAKRT
jgi:hypothetical protein